MPLRLLSTLLPNRDWSGSRDIALAGRQAHNYLWKLRISTMSLVLEPRAITRY